MPWPTSGPSTVRTTCAGWPNCRATGRHRRNSAYEPGRPGALEHPEWRQPRPRHAYLSQVGEEVRGPREIDGSGSGGGLDRDDVLARTSAGALTLHDRGAHQQL